MKLRYRFSLFFLFILFTLSASANAEEDISFAGGATTVDDATSSSFSHPLANLTGSKDLQEHDLGGQGFRRNFARSPVRGAVRIGPKFNNVSCVSCHRNNGRGVPEFGRLRSEAVVRVSRTVGRPAVPGGPIPIPGIGTQLHDHAIKGTRPDATIRIIWEELQGIYPDGATYRLRKPSLEISNTRVRLGSDTMVSLRRPPPVFGTGLLDAIDPSVIMSFVDEGDSNGDGISGRVNRVWDIRRKSAQVGKFGWKAGTPTAAQQIASAYSIDMGVTNPLIRRGQRIPDIDQRTLNRTIFFAQTLAVPKARDQSDPVVQRGKGLFGSLKCSGCHLMTLTTGAHQVKELSNQQIHPFTDLLLHDMGAGLSDNRSEFLATGSEWRTPPLWGIGLTRTTSDNGGESYLHDGRARTLEEAILWHGGEAEGVKQGFVSMDATDREALIRFLQSL